MKRFILVLLLSLTATASVAEQTLLTPGQQLKNAIAGSTVQGSMDGSGRYTEFYAKDGTVRSRDYQAKWSIEGDQMCWVYKGQAKDCWRASIKGNNVKWVKDGKVQGSGTIVQGNTNRY